MRAAGLLLAAMALGATATVHEWKKDVPEARRAAVNPYGSDEATLRAGAAVYAQRCASCHGARAEGRGRRPGLRTERVQGATDGELLWLLENGELRYGMPSWSGLPEEQRRQVERYVKSLGLAEGTGAPPR